MWGENQLVAWDQIGPKLIIAIAVEVVVVNHGCLFERGIEYARVVLASYFRAAVACSHDAMVVGATPKTFASSAWVRSFSARNLLSLSLKLIVKPPTKILYRTTDKL